MRLLAGQALELAPVKEKFYFSQLADDVFGGRVFSWHVDLFPSSNPKANVGSDFGAKSQCASSVCIRRDESL